MDYSKTWEVIRTLGEGGQGKVYLVNKKSEFTSEDAMRTALARMTKGVVYEKTREAEYQDFQRCLLGTINSANPSNQGALKVLHNPENARDEDLAKDRIKREIEAMSDIKHPNLAEIIDVDPGFQWYVSKYYSNGDLADKRGLFKGDFRVALKAIRPLVEGVAKLHEKNYVHRDIKPHNVFIGSNNELVLGDFGLIYFADSQHTRISATYDNVGSRDWMPPWAMGMRIEEVKQTFDVFALGKLLWYMVSGKSILPLWYFERPQHNVEEMFPACNYMKLANQLFTKCIVENERDCLRDAGVLLEQIDTLARIIDVGADPIGTNIERRCKVCGIGKYMLVVDDDPVGSRNFGITAAGSRKMKIFTCNHCGHVQLFSYEGEPPAAWE